MRHVIEPELTYRFVGGIGANARNVLLVDTTDIATDTNEAGLLADPALYCARRNQSPATDVENPPAMRLPPPRVGQLADRAEVFIDPNFGGALIPGRRNVFDSTLDMSGVAFLTDPRNLSPIISRMRFEAIDNLRVQWDLDYDPKQGRFGADNLYAGYSWGRTTVGLGPCPAQRASTKAAARPRLIQSQQLQPFHPDRQARTASDSTWPPTAATTSSTARCSMAASRPSTTGTAAA